MSFSYATCTAAAGSGLQMLVPDSGQPRRAGTRRIHCLGPGARLSGSDGETDAEPERGHDYRELQGGPAPSPVLGKSEETRRGRRLALLQTALLEHAAAYNLRTVMMFHQNVEEARAFAEKLPATAAELCVPYAAA